MLGHKVVRIHLRISCETYVIRTLNELRTRVAKGDRATTDRQL